MSTREWPIRSQLKQSFCFLLNSYIDGFSNLQGDVEPAMVAISKLACKDLEPTSAEEVREERVELKRISTRS